MREWKRILQELRGSERLPEVELRRRERLLEVDLRGSAKQSGSGMPAGRAGQHKDNLPENSKNRKKRKTKQMWHYYYTVF